MIYGSNFSKLDSFICTIEEGMESIEVEEYATKLTKPLPEHIYAIVPLIIKYFIESLQSY